MGSPTDRPLEILLSQCHISVRKLGAVHRGLSLKVLLFSDSNKNVRRVLKMKIPAEALFESLLWSVPRCY